MSKETLLAVCHTHDLSWDIDYDPPQCDCEFELLVIKDISHLTDDVQTE